MKMAAAAAADGDGGESRRTVAAGGRWEGGGCCSDGVARGALKAQGGCMGASRPWRREARERWVDFTELLLRWCGFYRVAPSFTTLFLPTLSYLPPGHCQRSRGVPILVEHTMLPYKRYISDGIGAPSPRPAARVSIGATGAGGRPSRTTRMFKNLPILGTRY